MLSKELTPVDEESVRAELEQLENSQLTQTTKGSEHRLAADVVALPTTTNKSTTITISEPVVTTQQPVVLLTAS